MKLPIATLAALTLAAPALACPLHPNHTAQSDSVKIAQSQRGDVPAGAVEETGKVDPNALKETSDAAKGG